MNEELTIPLELAPIARRQQLERAIEEALCDHLSGQGKEPKRQVVCGAGIADVVTEDAVYEVKAYLGVREPFFKAVGQATLYRQAIDPKKRAVIVGPNPDKELRSFAEQAGIEVFDSRVITLETLPDSWMPSKNLPPDEEAEYGLAELLAACETIINTPVTEEMQAIFSRDPESVALMQQAADFLFEILEEVEKRQEEEN